MQLGASRRTRLDLSLNTPVRRMDDIVADNGGIKAEPIDSTELVVIKRSPTNNSPSCQPPPVCTVWPRSNLWVVNPALCEEVSGSGHISDRSHISAKSGISSLNTPMN